MFGITPISSQFYEKLRHQFTMKKVLWSCYILVFFILVAVAFSPLTIPSGNPNPQLFGMPRTLWVGLIISILFVLLTILAATVGPQKNEDND